MASSDSKSPSPVSTDRELSPLVVYIQDEAAKVERIVAEALPHAINCGKALIQLKEKLDHGEFVGAVEANFSFTRQTASTYMRLARAADNDELEMEGALSISAARKQISPAPPEVDDLPDPGRRVKCPTCGHMVAPGNIGVWDEDAIAPKSGEICPTCGSADPAPLGPRKEKKARWAFEALMSHVRQIGSDSAYFDNLNRFDERFAEAKASVTAEQMETLLDEAEKARRILNYLRRTAATELDRLKGGQS